MVSEDHLDLHLHPSGWRLDLHNLLKPILERLGRMLVVAEPCLGIGGFGELMRVGGGKYEQVDACDADENLSFFYKRRAVLIGEHREDSPYSDATFGEKGRLELHPIKKLKDCDGVVTGPPCQGYSPCGKKLGAGDERSGLLDVVLSHIEEGGQRGSLLFFTLENSGYIAYRRNGDEPVAEKIVCRLRISLPHFIVERCLVELNEYYPHSRKRCWIRGVRIDMLGSAMSVPPPLPRLPSGRVGLMGVLDLKAPSISSTEEISGTRNRANLEHYNALIREHCASSAPVDVVAFDLCRKKDGKFGSNIYLDHVPALRTRGREIFVSSVADANEPIQRRHIFRQITDGERWELVGHQPAYVACCTALEGAKWTGNSYPIPMLAVVIIPILEALAASGKVQSDGIKRLSRDELEALAAKREKERMRNYSLKQPLTIRTATLTTLMTILTTLFITMLFQTSYSSYQAKPKPDA